MADRLKDLLLYFKASLEPSGFEVYPFLVGWYNEYVDSSYQLEYPSNTLAFMVLNGPSMFEKFFIPFVKSKTRDELIHIKDPIDNAMFSKMNEVREGCTLIDNKNIEMLFDYEHDGNYKYRILVQTAADVAGAVRLYQEKDVVDVENLKKLINHKIYPCALHPKYGGWYIMRCVYIFKDIIYPKLQRPERLEILNSQEQICDLLLKYNLHGGDWPWRDVGDPIERYSELQKQFCKGDANERKKIILEIKDSDITEGNN